MAAELVAFNHGTYWPVTAVMLDSLRLRHPSSKATLLTTVSPPVDISENGFDEEQAEPGRYIKWSSWFRDPTENILVQADSDGVFMNTLTPLVARFQISGKLMGCLRERSAVLHVRCQPNVPRYGNLQALADRPGIQGGFLLFNTQHAAFADLWSRLRGDVEWFEAQGLTARQIRRYIPFMEQGLYAIALEKLDLWDEVMWMTELEHLRPAYYETWEDVIDAASGGPTFVHFGGRKLSDWTSPEVAFRTLRWWRNFARNLPAQGLFKKSSLSVPDEIENPPITD